MASSKNGVAPLPGCPSSRLGLGKPKPFPSALAENYLSSAHNRNRKQGQGSDAGGTHCVAGLRTHESHPNHCARVPDSRVFSMPLLDPLQCQVSPLFKLSGI